MSKGRLERVDTIRIIAVDKRGKTLLSVLVEKPDYEGSLKEEIKSLDIEN